MSKWGLKSFVHDSVPTQLWQSGNYSEFFYVLCIVSLSKNNSDELLRVFNSTCEPTISKVSCSWHLLVSFLYLLLYYSLYLVQLAMTSSKLCSDERDWIKRLKRRLFGQSTPRPLIPTIRTLCAINNTPIFCPLNMWRHSSPRFATGTSRPIYCTRHRSYTALAFVCAKANSSRR